MNVPERSIPTGQAIALAEKEIRELGLTFRLNHSGNYLRTYRCSLYDHLGTEVSVGNGKGRGNQSIASALFEALEHFLTNHRTLYQMCDYDEISNMIRSDLLSTERVLEMLYQRSPRDRIPCRIYKSLSDSRTIYYPIFLSVPHYVQAPYPGDLFNYKMVSKYSTNNGTAIGLTATEATIHAVSELLERDALSCFLLRTFIRKQPSPIRLLDKRSLPKNSHVLIERAERAIGNHITLIDITSDFRLPACLAIVRRGDQVVPYVGSGASILPWYAVERAVLEVLQAFHLKDHSLDRKDAYILRRFGSLGRYKKCITLEFDNHQYVNARYEDLPKVTDKTSMTDYLGALVNLVKENGYSIYWTTNYKSAISDITCVHSVIPGLEKFHLIRSGLEVLPSRRGMKLLE